MPNEEIYKSSFSGEALDNGLTVIQKSIGKDLDTEESKEIELQKKLTAGDNIKIIEDSETGQTIISATGGGTSINEYVKNIEVNENILSATNIKNGTEKIIKFAGLKYIDNDSKEYCVSIKDSGTDCILVTEEIK